MIYRAQRKGNKEPEPVDMRDSYSPTIQSRKRYQFTLNIEFEADQDDDYEINDIKTNAVLMISKQTPC